MEDEYLCFLSQITTYLYIFTEFVMSSDLINEKLKDFKIFIYGIYPEKVPSIPRQSFV